MAPFAGSTMIGDDPDYVADGSHIFNGSIDSVAVYGQALSETALLQMFTNATGISSYPPFNSVAPAYQSLYAGQIAQFSSQVAGTPPFTYTWQINGVNLTDGPNSIGTVVGSATASLTLSNLAAADAGQTYYVTLVTRNNAGSYTNSIPAVLNVQTPPPAATIGTLSFSGSGPALEVTLAGAAGQASGTYRVLTTTNVAAALSTWSVVTNGTFDASGNFTATFPASATSAQQFYSVVQP